MTSVVVRELRQRASALLRLVEAGETIEVTDEAGPWLFWRRSPAVEPWSSCEPPATSPPRRLSSTIDICTSVYQAIDD
jgi:hypothetical protein